jgi:hypothetical protein
MKRQIVFFLFLMGMSCQKKTENTVYKNIELENSYFKKISEANKIIIAKKIDENKFSNGFVDKRYEANQLNQVIGFINMLKQSHSYGYECCPSKHYSISFYNDSNKITTYYADTIAEKQTIKVFQSDYQFCYIIENNLWNKYLTTLKDNRTSANRR